MKNRQWYIAAIVLALLVVIGGVYAQRTQSPTSTSVPQGSLLPTIAVKGNTVRVTIASTAAEREQGLSGRTGLAPDEGMLFVFASDGDYAFWMKDMLFSIDIVWIDNSGTIVYIAPSVSPDTYPAAFDPKMNARYVLELPAGYMQSHDVRAGDRVDL